ncbi:MAG: RNA-binding protein [Desulfobulbaceae bacterium]|nr:RNA-binding protein [Desulfobulbaceae bacterium]HIJ79360.1 RNA-binding protein [Deltaproteobacteria bacterium]
MKIYVGNLPHGVEEDELRGIFSEYGEIASISLIKDRFSGQSKGFGFVDMPNNSEADKVIKSLNKTTMQGRTIKVNQVEPPKKGRKNARRGR